MSGGLAYGGAMALHWSPVAAQSICGGVIIVLRWLALHYNLSLPVLRYTPEELKRKREGDY